MATAKKNWGSAVEADSAQLCAHDTENFSADVDLETLGYEGCLVEMVITWPASADQNLIVAVLM